MANMIRTLRQIDTDYPDLLRNITDAPKQLYYLYHGTSLAELLARPSVAVVGSRRVTPYGKAITEAFAGELADKQVTIISGLALGVDGLAHKAALTNSGKTIAVLPCGLDRIYPSSHHQLAQNIIKAGGALVSEYPSGTEPLRHNFIARNRIVSGLSQAVLITEAAEKSGTLHTANFALEQGREVLAVPGNITSPLSKGTNNLIKSGALPATDVRDILKAIGKTEETNQVELISDNREEHTILSLIQQGYSDGDELQSLSGLTPSAFNQTLTMLEITGKIRAIGSNHWSRH